MGTYWLAYTYLEVHIKYLSHKHQLSPSFDLQQSHDKLEKLIKFLEKWLDKLTYRQDTSKKGLRGYISKLFDNILQISCSQEYLECDVEDGLRVVRG